MVVEGCVLDEASGGYMMQGTDGEVDARKVMVSGSEKMRMDE